MKKHRYILAGVGSLWLAAAVTAQVNPANPATANAAPEDEAVELEQFIVTGVFSETAANQATVAISTINTDMLRMQVPVSGIDLLLNVPGVFVNSAHGEIRGVVYSRGISADSGLQTNGFYYVSLQEDGLPITTVNFGNYGPDYFHRPDATMQRVEAVRGGSAAITSANAPGGVFNYISKTGTPVPSGEIRVRFGMEGDWSPLFRGDINLGGPIGDTGWLYNVGGFYRESDGHRPAKGYPMNNGYQIKGNIFKDYGAGEIKVYAKYLDDHNHWYEYLFARNVNDPKQAPGTTRFSTNLWPGPATHQFPFGSADTMREWDVTDKIRSQQKVLGVNWRHEFGDGWVLRNDMKFSRSWADWNSSASVTPRSMAWPNLFSSQGYSFNQTMVTPSGNVAANVVPAGWYNFYLRGQLVARVSSNGSYTSTGSAPSAAGQVVEFSNLPNKDFNIGSTAADGLKSFDAVWSNSARAAYEHMDEFMESFSITKNTDNMSFTAGIFYAYADMDSRTGSGGNGLMTIEEQPEVLNVTWTPARTGAAPTGTSAANIAAVSGWAAYGRDVQMTNVNGYTNIGAGLGHNEGVGKMMAAFFGHKWTISDQWNVDWGIRAENYAVTGWNHSSVRNPRGLAWDHTYGGADGDPLTFYDNRFFIKNPEVSPNGTRNSWNYDKDVDSFSWSIGTNYVINDKNSFYVRYSDGEKAPTWAFFRTYNSQFRLDNLVGQPQSVIQWELGYRFDTGRMAFVVTPFWSRLDDIWSSPQATDLDGSLYFPEPYYNATTSYGIELEGTYQITERLSLRSVFAVTESEGTRWKNFQANQPGRDDDEFLDFSGKPQANVPDFTLNTSLSYRTEKLSASLAWKHMGERAGNIANVITLPRFDQFDLTLGYAFTDRLSVNLNVNNLTDSEGVMSWEGWGVNPGNKESFTVQPTNPSEQTLQYVPIQPRAYYLSASYRF